MAKFIPLGDRSMKMKTVLRATTNFFNAWQVHDFASLMRYIGRHSQFLVNTLLPPNGYYTGKRGYWQMVDKWWRTAPIKDSTYRIKFVDEARQISVVTKSCTGVFRHNGASFENVKMVIFIQWDMGKISKLNMVEANPEKTYSLFLTKAHKQFNKLLEGLYRGGNDMREAINSHMSDDISISFNNVSPLSLLVADAANATKYEGQDLIVTLKGKNNVMKLAALGDKLLFNLTSDIKVLFSDDTTVVAANILKPTTHLFLPSNQKTYWKSVTILYTINRFDDQGMLKDAQWIINRPFLPHQLRRINDLLIQNGQSSLSSLLAPIRESIVIQAAKK